MRCAKINLLKIKTAIDLEYIHCIHVGFLRVQLFIFYVTVSLDILFPSITFFFTYQRTIGCWKRIHRRTQSTARTAMVSAWTASSFSGRGSVGKRDKKCFPNQVKKTNSKKKERGRGREREWKLRKTPILMEQKEEEMSTIARHHHRIMRYSEHGCARNGFTGIWVRWYCKTKQHVRKNEVFFIW